MQIARLCTLVLASASGCYQPDFAGLECRDDRECGTLACVDGVCGGDEPGSTGGPPDTTYATSSSDEPAPNDPTTETTDASASADASTSTDGTPGALDTTGEPETTTTGADDGSDTPTDEHDDTIYEIQQDEFDWWDVVDVRHVVVTAIASSGHGFFAQEHAGGEYSGVWVYVGSSNQVMTELAVGDEVNITGEIHEYHDLTELDAREGSVVRTGVTGVHLAPELLPISTFGTYTTAEPWEGVLVAIVGAPLTVSALLPAHEFAVTGTDTVVLDDLVYDVWEHPADLPDFGIDARFSTIVGPLNAYNNTFKIAVRDADDFTGYKPPAAPKLGIEALQPGDLVITEVMYNPATDNDDGEYIEVYNTTSQPIEMYGAVIQDSLQSPTHQGKINSSAVVQPGAFALLGFRSMVTWPYPNKPDAFYGYDPPLNNGSLGDTVFLKNSTLTIDATSPYIGKAGDKGVSWKLKPTKSNADDNDDPTNWCYSAAVFFMAEHGSPGQANEVPCSM